MTDTPAQIGLRERKRMATRRAIERAVLTLSLEHGFENVTVEDISQVADISARTFFNYFPTKEAAVIGDVPALPEGAIIDVFVTGSDGKDILGGICELLALSADDEAGQSERDLHQLRRRLMRDNQKLFSQRMLSMRRLEADLDALVRRRIAHDEPELAADNDALVMRARLVTLVAFAGIRFAWWCWADQGGTEPLSKRLRESFAQLRELGSSMN